MTCILTIAFPASGAAKATSQTGSGYAATATPGRARRPGACFSIRNAPGSHARQWGNDTSVVRKHVENQRARGILRQGVRAKFPYPEHPCLISTPRTGFPTLPPGHVHFSHRQPTGPCRAAQRGSRRRTRWPAGRWPSSCGTDASGRTMLPMAASLVASTCSAIGGQ